MLVVGWDLHSIGTFCHNKHCIGAIVIVEHVPVLSVFLGMRDQKILDALSSFLP